jgi:uncharacterized membrane protein
VDVPQVLAVWLHTVALVIAWGYYGILGRIALPALARSLDRPALATALLGMERRAVPLVALSALLFTLTGSYLLVIDPHYAGLGNVFASTWTRLMLAKHVLVIGFVALAVVVDLLVRRIARTTEAEGQARDLRRLGFSAEAATGLGALIVLLTAAAQVAA